MIPVSSKYEKYNSFYESQVQKYGKCTKVVLGSFAGADHAFLVQNAFPVIDYYFDHIHTRFGQPATISQDTAKKIIQCLKSNLAMRKRGVNLFFADIERLYKLMSEKLTTINE